MKYVCNTIDKKSADLHSKNGSTKEQKIYMCTTTTTTTEKHKKKYNI